MSEALYFAFFLGVPLLIVLATRRFQLAAKVGAIVLCYAIGLLVGLSGILPESSYAARTTLSEVSLVFALPMLLFGVDVLAWRRIAGAASLSMLCAVIAVTFIATLLYFWLIGRGIEAPEQFSAMAVGMYTGGVANLAAMKVALDIPDERFTIFATVDTAIGGLYLLFMLTLAKSMFGKFLPSFNATDRQDTHVQHASAWERGRVVSALVALLPAAVCVGLALFLAPFFQFAQFEIVVIVLLTTFGLISSFIPVVRSNPLAEPIGMFLIYVFTFCVAASLDLRALANVELTIFGFVILATVGTVLVHAALCRLFRVDVETFLVTSVAALLSPAFVPMIVQRLQNPALLMSGVAVGILGFAIGNYLGISVALILAR